jgi:uncharacterized membrane protein YphA (DoxX/SURF4 family)
MLQMTHIDWTQGCGGRTLPPCRRPRGLAMPAASAETGASTVEPRLIAYRIATVVAALAFTVPGIGNLIRAAHIAQDMAHLGYPSYFLTILGTWKVLGAIVVAAPRLPRLKEWAYAGMIFDLTGAAASRAFMGDDAPLVLVPLAIAGVVLASWSLRPPSRRLESPRSLEEGR